MTETADTAFAFVLNALDPDLLSPCLATRFVTSDLDTLRQNLSIDAADDPLIDNVYTLAPPDAAALCAAMQIDFDSGPAIVTLHKDNGSRGGPPYLVHTGWELPLLLQGRKKFAVMHFTTRADHVALKRRFDHFVAMGQLHAEEHVSGEGTRHQTIHAVYTPPGDAWRIEADKLIHRCAGLSGGWNEHYERLLGMLMGYEDWQNDWWLEELAKHDKGWFGISLTAAVTRAGLEWIAHAGNRALPPIEGDIFIVASTHMLQDETMQFALRDNPHIDAFVQFNIDGRHLIPHADMRVGGTYALPASAIPELNRHLRRPVRIVAQRSSSAFE
ncbi:hypothetical protein NUV26_24255 [Burkholderia pseudomultivorans]|uniref:hypothetical protein n=1 Tax=Burkholderia pseudomultivorans TaxID=1207504 RepID=UPI000754D5DE|nr:hypothetical protein [Burkholderia pseudomultivorans]AOI88363.1 hypothetical protein WS57_05900 [Burkholderia pseudomultivorans]KVC25214.1 hypothetical protein WS55_16385 [Burkholderia pseudomultivorans]KVC27489.1 hypothetical protein WS56_23020 [Burkholderia pseudomultivorans]KVC37135.1 hypothetical protein WS58_24885 [Burkholderia pseudomultivorans]MDS0795288.1 hypothetical protein [Burkholderia pseudomultivorans]